MDHHVKEYIGVFIALLILTVVTVWIAQFDFGDLNIVVAMGVATIKAALVAFIFMHLKGDNWLNNTVFFSSFFFLALFVGFTLTDLLVRPAVSEVKINAVEPPASMQAAKMAELRNPTDELIKQGKELYAVQCATCHGATGLGDGPAAAAFNPKPRNFTNPEWKQGGTPAELYNTLVVGLGSMPAFPTLSVEERWAVVHYVRTMVPESKKPADNAESLKLIGLSADGKVDSSAQQETRPELPIDYIIKRMTQGS